MFLNKFTVISSVVLVVVLSLTDKIGRLELDKSRAYGSDSEHSGNETPPASPSLKAKEQAEVDSAFLKEAVYTFLKVKRDFDKVAQVAGTVVNGGELPRGYVSLRQYLSSSSGINAQGVRLAANKLLDIVTSFPSDATNRVSHRNINQDTVLIGSNPRDLKLSGWTMATNNSATCLPIEYLNKVSLPPQYLIDCYGARFTNSDVGMQVDLWQIGVLLIEMLFGGKFIEDYSVESQLALSFALTGNDRFSFDMLPAPVTSKINEDSYNKALTDYTDKIRSFKSRSGTNEVKLFNNIVEQFLEPLVNDEMELQFASRTVSELMHRLR